MAIDYKQYNYPNYPYCDESIATTGCGPTSVADILEKDPREIAQWMTNHGYASSHNGTIWAGISECLKAYGGGGVMVGTGQDGRSDGAYINAWREAIHQGCMGVLLMHGTKHGCKDNYWTYGGHYIAVVGYDATTGRYLVYDPASVERTRWHAWADFAGDISALYTSTIRWKESGGDLKVDGLWGPGTTKAAQRVFSTGTVDGIISNQNRDRRMYLQNCQTASWEFVPPNNLKSGSALIKAIQHSIGAKVDGFFGDESVRRFQKWLGVEVDGFCGSETVSAFQRWLNRQ